MRIRLFGIRERPARWSISGVTLDYRETVIDIPADSLTAALSSPEFKRRRAQFKHACRGFKNCDAPWREWIQIRVTF